MTVAGGYIGLYDLYQHIYTHVRAATNNQQDPMLTILEGVGPFPVALYKGGAVRDTGSACNPGGAARWRGGRCGQKNSGAGIWAGGSSSRNSGRR